MSSTYEWINNYIQALPPTIRPAADDSRFVAAARRALGNKWTPTAAATAVAARSYEGATNPVLLAIIRLEQLADTAPFTQPAKMPACRCGEPHQHIPEEWVKQRWDLIRELSRTPDLTEDEREQAMSVLIAAQKAGTA